MERVLYLLRHAKSDWGNAGLPDRERPLVPRGERAAASMDAALALRGIHPDLVLCSPAVRTRETLQRMPRSLGGAEQRIEDGLYEARPGLVLDLLRGLPADPASVLVLGHNPWIQGLALLLSREEPSAPGGPVGRRPAGPLYRLRKKYPTCALASLELGVGSWRDLEPGRARLTGFLTPADLDPP